MLQRAIRLAIVAVVSLVVPIQGIGGVTSGQCMSLDHHDSGTAMAAHGHGGPATDGSAHASHAHEGKTATKSPGDSKSDPCGPCAACCASTSIAGPLPLLNVPALTGADYAFSRFPPPGVQPDGLDRPPLAL